MNILCVLRSGGIYDAEWVRKLRDGVARHMSQPHTFKCISDVEVPCERIALEHDWPGWWAKVELFKPNLIQGPTLYLDLDTVITGDLSELTNLPYDFAMLSNFHSDEMVGSGVMWFKDKAPEGVYERFVEAPQRVMDHYQRVKVGPYMGDQAFIWDSLDRHVDKIKHPSVRSYKKHCRNGLPENTSIVCFHGRPRPTEINPDWMECNWI